VLAIVLLLAAPLTGEISVSTPSPQAAAFFRQGRERLFDLDVPGAEKMFREALALDAGFPLAKAWLSRAVGGSEGVALAEQAFAAAKSLPEAERLEIESLLCERRGEEQRTRLLKRQLADLAPHDWAAQYLQAVQSQWDGKSQAAQLYLNRAIAIDPKQPGPYNYLAYTYATQGMLDDAVATERKLIALAPGESNPWDSLGDFLLRQNKLDEADEAFAKAVELQAENWMALIGRAYVRFFRDDLSGGQEMLTGARNAATGAMGRLMPTVVQAWAQLAADDGKAALHTIDELEKASHGKKEELAHVWAPLERGELLLEMGRAADAPAQFRTALDRSALLAGDDAKRLRRYAFVGLQRAAIERGDLDAAAKALAELRKLGEEGKENVQVHTAVLLANGRDHLAHGRLAEAIKELSRCPKNAWACQTALAEAQQRAGSAQAQDTVARLIAANVRDAVHRGEDPAYLYPRAQFLRRGKLAASQ
jgi:Flp pilus assembly protein TadD